MVNKIWLGMLCVVVRNFIVLEWYLISFVFCMLKVSMVNLNWVYGVKRENLLFNILI